MSEAYHTGNIGKQKTDPEVRARIKRLCGLENGGEPSSVAYFDPEAKEAWKKETRYSKRRLNEI